MTNFSINSLSNEWIMKNRVSELKSYTLCLFLTASIRPYLSNPMLKVFMAVYSILLKFLCPQTGDENDNIYIFRVL